MSITTDDTTYNVSQSQETTSYENVTIETTIFLSTTTITSNNHTSINTTTLTPPKGLSGGAIAGIIIGAIAGVIVLLLLGYIIYKYRKTLADMLRRSPRPSNNNSVRYKADVPPTNINLSPPDEYLTVHTPSRPIKRPPDGR